jgi:hypothetical protein
MEFLDKLEVSDLKLGDCLLYNKHTFLGRSIQIICRSHYNHASIFNGINEVYEAVSPKFKLTDIKESYKDAVEVLVQRPKFYFNHNEIISVSNSLIGLEYYYISIYYELIRQLWGGWEGDKNMRLPFCSKAVAYAYYIATKCKLFEQYYQYTPDDLYKMRKYFDTFELILN